MAIPKQVELENYQRLSSLLITYGINEVLILGDLFHSDYNSEWRAFSKFLAKFSEVSFHLILGNHDILEDKNYQIPNLRTHSNDLVLEKFRFSHFPNEDKTYYNFCGHIHPAVKIKGQGKQSLRLPCFYFSPDQAILPAFGAFTGMETMTVKKQDKVFAILEDQVIQVS